MHRDFHSAQMRLLYRLDLPQEEVITKNTYLQKQEDCMEQIITPIEGGIDEVLYCAISGTTTVQINIDYLEI